MYKESLFNIVIDDNMIWNTRNGAFAIISPDELNYLRNFSGNSDNSELFYTLLNNGFLVSSDRDEISELLFTERELVETNAPSDLFFSIAPTLNCNYSCEYCFEASRDIRCNMSDEVADKVSSFLSETINTNDNLKRVHVTFFGGEPLLQLQTINTICSALSRSCIEKEAEFRPAIITNGRFLDSEAISLLKRFDFKSVQISMDFDCDKYCEVRKATQHDFFETVANILNAASQLKRILVRINVRDHDISDAKKIVDLLLSNRIVSKSLRFYLANIKEGEKSERIKKHSEFVDVEADFIKWISTTYGSDRYFHKKPLAKGVSCRLSCDSNFCIGPMGELYKCDYHFGNTKYIVGNVVSGFIPEKKEWYHRYSIRTTVNEKCRTCKMFPVCMSGCVNNQIQGEKLFNCSKYIEQMIRRKILSHFPDDVFAIGDFSWS